MYILLVHTRVSDRQKASLFTALYKSLCVYVLVCVRVFFFCVCVNINKKPFIVYVN